ncbi:GbsR/MarR family transcriptional regulator [Myroides guanonis]|nr:transcriptional regulator [Myroides guanonis]
MEYEQDIIDFFQDYCAHHEALYHYSPLTSKLYTFLLFSGMGDGVTFDEIVEKLNASKSSISTSLNVLLNNNQIEQFNKIDERKRYFRINPKYLTNRLFTIKKSIEKELDLTCRLLEFNQNNKLNVFKCESRINVYIEHLEKSSEELSQTIEKLKNSN